MPPTGTKAAQLAQLHAEKLLNHLLEAIMGYPPNSRIKQALTSARVGSVKGFTYLGWGAAQSTNFHGWIGREEFETP